MFCVKTIAQSTPRSEKLVNQISSLNKDLNLERDQNRALSLELAIARKEIEPLNALVLTRSRPNEQVEPLQVPPQNLPTIQINGIAQNDEAGLGNYEIN